jgi:hypothetical protein
MAGEWAGETRTWFEPGELADTQPQQGTMRLVGNGQFILHEYATTLMDNACQGLMLIGYSAQHERYEAAWVDNCHNSTNIMFLTGGPAGDHFAATGSYAVAEGDPWGWRVEIELHGADQMTISMFNITPAGAEALGVQTSYQRIRVL